jgi:hypothetical protein
MRKNWRLLRVRLNKIEFAQQADASDLVINAILLRRQPAKMQLSRSDDP